MFVKLMCTYKKLKNACAYPCIFGIHLLYLINDCIKKACYANDYLLY
jgi:hypothetical protein